jgi:hypothetical protein
MFALCRAFDGFERVASNGFCPVTDGLALKFFVALALVQRLAVLITNTLLDWVIAVPLTFRTGRNLLTPIFRKGEWRRFKRRNSFKRGDQSHILQTKAAFNPEQEGHILFGESATG